LIENAAHLAFRCVLRLEIALENVDVVIEPLQILLFDRGNAFQHLAGVEYKLRSRERGGGFWPEACVRDSRDLAERELAPMRWDVAKRHRLPEPSSTAKLKNPHQLYRMTVARMKAQMH